MNSLPRILLFISTFTAIYCGMHLAAAQWLIAHFQLPAGKVRLIFLLLALSFFLCAWLVRLGPCPFTRFFMTAAYIWMGVLFIWLSVLTASLIIELPLRLAGLNLTRHFGWGVIAVTAALSVYALAAAYRTPRIKEVRIEVPGLKKELQGLRLAQISDIHLSPTVGPASLRRMVRQLGKIKPDVILMSGDIIDPGAYRLEESATMLAALKPAYGKYAVFGNHEYYFGLDKAAAFLQNSGFTLLNRGIATLPNGLEIAGIDDIRSAGRTEADVDNLLARLSTSAVTVYMTHQPVLLGPAEKRGITLTISGHTHGGQIFPFSLLVKAHYKNRYSGRYPLGTGTLYINPGTFHWGPPMRLFVPEEITVFTLEPK